jgi:hypothetical protein
MTAGSARHGESIEIHSQKKAPSDRTELVLASMLVCKSKRRSCRKAGGLKDPDPFTR